MRRAFSKQNLRSRQIAGRNSQRSVAAIDSIKQDAAKVSSGGIGQDEGSTARFPYWKRVLDLTIILFTVPVWLPLMVMVMLMIRLKSDGPIFYRQERVGYRRHRFMIFKFRTMHVNADTRTHEDYFASLMRSEVPMTKLDAAGDSRLIPGARFLRASGLDELPQIFNVVRGEMSLVGPRPCLPSEFDRYEVWQQKRVNAPPGVTGYWQVNGKNKTTFGQMMFMDLFYIDKMSLWRDLGIILKTIPVLVFESVEALKRYRSRKISDLERAIPQSLTAVPNYNGTRQPSRNGAHKK